MENKRMFADLSEEECSVAYKLFFDTAESAWENGINLAYKGSYGFAVSTLFISIEEYVKSFVIFLDSKGFHFRHVKEVEHFFENHQIRYVIAYFMFTMSIVGDELKKFILSVRENPAKVQILYNEIKASENYFETKLLFYLKRKAVLLRKEFAWFAKAEVFQQAGMHCNFKDMFASPLTVSKSEYRDVFIRLERVKDVMKYMVAGFESTDETSQIQIERIKVSFEKHNHYKKISDALLKLSHSKMAAFDYLRKQASLIE